eukprot:1458788-Rhodomonas_salina.2
MFGERDKSRLRWRRCAQRGQSGATLLYIAALSGHAEVVDRLISARCNIKLADPVSAVLYMR